jgi:hypothetical protein
MDTLFARGRSKERNRSNFSNGRSKSKGRYKKFCKGMMEIWKRRALQEEV